ncbi:MAG: hypothetical protein EPO08_21280 [Rhodospirillaceae bacterium]|nr:MAG: hypothetical protein EPO08_21280 [Rhodospirillaceae bacterium]
MAADNVLGSVSIVISGDTSKLQADFARATAIATTSGAQVSNAFNQSAAGADKVVIAIGRLAGIIQQESAAASLAAQRNLALAVAHAQVERSANSAAGGIRRIGEAGEHVVPQMAAASGAVRTAFGEQSIRAVERFITLIPGVGAALQLAFPLIGAFALIEMITRMLGKVHELTEAEKALAEATKQNDAEWERLAGELEHVDIERMTAEFGKLAGLKLKGFYDKAEADRDRTELANTAAQIERMKKTLADTQALYSNDPLINTVQAFNPLIVGERLGAENQKDQIANIKKQQDAYDTLQEKIRVFDNQQQHDAEERGRTALQQAGALSQALLANQEKALAGETDAKKRALDLQAAASHGARETEIAGIADSDTRQLRSAQEAIRAASEKYDGIIAVERDALSKRIAIIRQLGAAEAAGKDQPAQQRIGIETQGKVAEATRAEKTEEDAAAREVFNTVTSLEVEKGRIIAKQANDAALVWDEAFSTIDNEAIKTEDAITKAAEANAVSRVRVIETGEKSKGVTDELKILQEKLQLERQYGLEVIHTGAQQVAFAHQIDDIEKRARDARITGLKADLAKAVANSKDVEADEKVAILRAEIAKLTAESANLAIEAKTKELELEQKITLQYKLRAAVAKAGEAVPGAVGAGLAKGIIDGKGIGRDIRDSLKGVGQELLGSVFHQLIASILTNTLGIHANTAVVGAHSGIMGIHLGVMTAHLGVMGAHLGIMTAHLAVVIVNSAVTVANTIATIAQTIASFFHFAEGGRPPVGVASIIGEKGPELFIPDTAGQIVPAGKFGGVGLQLPQIGGISQSTSTTVGGSHVFNIYGATSPRESARAIATYIKNASPQFSPYASK